MVAYTIDFVRIYLPGGDSRFYRIGDTLKRDDKTYTVTYISSYANEIEILGREGAENYGIDVKGIVLFKYVRLPFMVSYFPTEEEKW